MFINPKQALEDGWLRGIPEEDVQPNAVDIAADGLSQINQNREFTLYRNGKTHRGVKEMQTEGGLWTLDPNCAYDFTSPAYVEVPEGVVGWLVTRSTLNRNGVFVLSGLYDSGFKGHVCGILYNLIGKTTIERDSRVAQFILASSDSAGVYAGGYNVEEGDMWYE
jgi:deoxycytidine triphosphate deaminase